MEAVTWRGNRETKLCHESHDFRKETMMNDICKIVKQTCVRKYVLSIQRKIEMLQLKVSRFLKNIE